jgi:hypothetical protein
MNAARAVFVELLIVNNCRDDSTFAPIPVRVLCSRRFGFVQPAGEGEDTRTTDGC